jgi:hypothetical protein
VTINGQPIPAEAQARVTFVPTSTTQGDPATVEIVGGKYDCPNAPQGNVLAQFSITKPGAEYMSGRGEKARELIILVPAASTAGVTIEVTDDNLEQNFDLK